MLKMTLKSLLIASLLAGATAATAEETAKKTEAAKLDPAAEKAAYALMETLGTKKNIDNFLNGTLEKKVKLQPTMAPYKEMTKKFFAKYSKWDDIKKEIAAYYAKAFTTEEMKELNKFYSTDLGKKAYSRMPVLYQLSIFVAQKHIAQHSSELKKSMADKARKLAKDSKK